jgi:hypothetical protein
MDKTWSDCDDASLERQPRADNQPAAELVPGLVQGPDSLRDQFGLSVEQQGDWLRIHMHAGRQLATAATTGVFACFFAAAALWLPVQGPDSWLFRDVFAAFAAALLLVTIYLPGNSIDIRVGVDAIWRLRLFCGVVIHRQRIRPQQVQALEIEAGTGLQSGGRITHSYRLTGSGEFGSLRLLDGISDRTLMETLRAQIITAAGLHRERVAAG